MTAPEERPARDKSSLLLAFNWFSFVAFAIVIVLVAHGMYWRIGENSIDLFTRDTIESTRAIITDELAELNDQLAAADDQLSRIHDRCRNYLLANGSATSLDSLRSRVNDRVLDGDNVDIAIVGTNAVTAPISMTATGMALHVWSQLVPQNLYLQLRLRTRAIDLAWERLRHCTLSTQREAKVSLYLATRKDHGSGQCMVKNLFDLTSPVDTLSAHQVEAALGVTNGFVRARTRATTRDYCFALPCTLVNAPGTDAQIVCKTTVDIRAYVATHNRALKLLGGLVLVFIFLSVIEFAFLIKRYIWPLHASRQMLETVLNTIPARVFWKDTSLRYLGCNRQFAHDIGVASPMDIVGKTDHELVGREFAERHRADDRTVIESGMPKFNYEEQSVIRDGHAQWLRSNKVPLRAPTGKVIGVLGTFENITEQKEIKENLLRRLAFEKTLATLSARLCDTVTIPDLIEQSLGEMAAALRVQAARIFKYIPGPDGTMINVVFQWCAHEAPEHQDQVVSVRSADFPWSYARIAEDKPLVVGDINALPTEAEERASFARVGVQAFLAVPIRKFDLVDGLVSAVCFDGPRAWHEDEVDFFVICAQIISGAIERHEIYCDLRQHRDNLEHIVDCRTKELVLINNQLRISEALYFSTISSLRDWIHVVDRDMRILFANQAYLDACKKFGLNACVVGANIFELAPFLGEKVRQEYNQVFATGEALVTLEQNTLDGRTMFTKTKKTPVFVDGVVAHVVTFIENITEQKMKGQALHESEVQYRALFNGSPIGIAEHDWSVIKHCLNQVRTTDMMDLDAYLTQHPERVSEFWSNSIVLDANPALLRMYGAEFKNHLFVDIVSLFPHEAFAAIKAFLLAIARGEHEYETETIMPMSDRGRRHVVIKWRVVQGYEATYGKVVLTFVDISARTHAEEQKARFAALVESSREFIGMATLDGRVTYLNRAGREMVGFGPDDDVTHTMITDYVPEDRRKNIALEVMDAVKNAGVWHGEGVLRHFHAHTLEDVAITTFLVPAPTADAQPCIATVMRSISARKRADAQIHQYEHQLRAMTLQIALAEDKERRRIATGLHDDVCQTLALAKMKLGMARFGVRHARLRDEIASSVEAAIVSLRSLMFDLSPPALYELGLGPAIEWLADRMQHQHGLDCVFTARTSLDSLDEKMRAILYFTIRELMMNVVKHAHARRATITADIHGGSVCIVVADNGRGIAATADNQKTFGLFSVRERLRIVGGTLDIQSQKGKGTTAVVAIPLPSGVAKEKMV